MDMQERLEKATEYHKYDWLEEAERFYRLILETSPDHPEVNYRLGDIAMRVNKPEMAVPFFEKALQSTPDETRYRQSLADAKAHLEAMASDDRIVTCKIFEARGNDFIYERKIHSLENKVRLLNDKVNNLLEALNHQDLFTMETMDDPSARMLPVERMEKGATKTLIAFGGMASGLSLPPREFFRSLRSETMNLIFVKDFRQCWYQKGLLGKTEDIDGTVAYLKTVIPDTTRELITVGASAGGYAAIRFGTALDADRVLAFSPQTLIDEETVGVFGKHCLHELPYGSDDLDLGKLLEKQQGKTQIEVYYGKHNNRDRRSVERIRPYVKEFAYETDEHLVASFLKADGTLQEILDSI